jgi:predicted benzoate:H+ symporter BenE
MNSPLPPRAPRNIVEDLVASACTDTRERLRLVQQFVTHPSDRLFLALSVAACGIGAATAAAQAIDAAKGKSSTPEQLADDLWALVLRPLVSGIINNEDPRRVVARIYRED